MIIFCVYMYTIIHITHIHAFESSQKMKLKWIYFLVPPNSENHTLFFRICGFYELLKLFIRKAEKDRRRMEKETERDLPSIGSLSKCLHQPRLGWAETRSLELSPGLPCKWQHPSTAATTFFCLECTLAQSWNGEKNRSLNCWIVPAPSGVFKRSLHARILHCLASKNLIL